jgi:hypothetical protein
VGNIIGKSKRLLIQNKICKTKGMRVMRTSHIRTMLVGILLCSAQHLGLAQGFVDLDFESAIIVPDPTSPYSPNAVYASDALPGWTVTDSFIGPKDILYNDLSLGAPSVSIFDAGGPNAIYYTALDGEFSVDLYGGTEPATGVSISQTGLVPANAASIQFIAAGFAAPIGEPMVVSLGGQTISYSAISAGPNYTLYGGNIPSGLAGQSEPLTFLASNGVNNYWKLDDIQFSTTPVPEPNSFGLFALGALFLGCRHRAGSSNAPQIRHEK